MKKISLILVAFILVLSCKDDDDFSIETSNQNITNEEFALMNFGATSNSNFFGRIVNTNGQNIKDVLITIGNESTYTDHNGIFTFTNASVYENFALIKASKDGYIQASRALIPNSNSTNDVQITLLEKNIVASISSGSASEVILSNGSSVSFGGDFVDSNGNPYNGKIDVSVHYVEPNQESTFTEMPGMLFGQRENGSASAMETYGMLAVNLYAPSGEELNITETSPATLKFPVSVSTPNAPTEIPLWYFDEEVGYWREEGTATKVGNEYIAQVSHFTWWNCDVPLDDINMCFTLQYENTTVNETNPIANHYFEINRNSTGQLIYAGYTNDVGEECGVFPKNEAVTIDVYGNDACATEIIHSQSLGPYNSDTSIQITIPSLSSELSNATVKATVIDCSGNPMTNGYAVLYNQNSNAFDINNTVYITDGTVNTSLLYCNAASYAMVIFDLNTNNITDKILLNLSPNTTTDLGVLSSCGNTTGGTYVGNVTIKNQQELDFFGLFGYSEIQGDLTIHEDNSTRAILSSLQPLSSLQQVQNFNLLSTGLSSLTGLENLSVSGNFYMSDDTIRSLHGLQGISNVQSLAIYNCDGLTTLNGLHNLVNVDYDFYLLRNPLIQNFTGLDNVQSVGYFNVQDCTSLQNIEGLTSFNSSFDLKIENCQSFSSLNGIDTILSNSATIDRIHLKNNDVLNTLGGLENLQKASYLVLESNSNLTDLSALVNLITLDALFIRDNNALTSLDGLDNLASVNWLGIGTYGSCTGQGNGGNVNLQDFCALSNLIVNGSIGTSYHVCNNANNPSISDIQAGNCN
ncbi:carboxypeptidase-like regulatory domain-containing protein [Tenacibaculum agarivorans]|uniref:carboxypeptidase-like regulatory domain-containing protein n=1 Tax=Tenacibaculum agarivorans TaxID=1908389 RepID=UPI000ACE2193|nr:carboxypeptidase-like regulatory domain-containing protein [Tenacibaculum agarivorans]